MIESAVLDLVFGPGSGTIAEARATASARTFVRSMDQLALDSPNARGRRLTAREALDAYGIDPLVEVAREGAALLSEGPHSASRLLTARRRLLRLRSRDVAASANVPVDVIEAAERSARVPIQALERIARALGLDERLVSWRSEPATGNEELAVRLRSIGDALPRMSPVAVAGLAEAAWVATTQVRLQRQLGIQPSWPEGLDYSTNYGGFDYPAYQHGYWLAGDARDRLQLGCLELPVSLRQLAEDRLGIPIVQADLGPAIAGATVETGDERAIVLNVAGRNRNVFVRRATMAHELGHLLYDPPRDLRRLRVDEYEQLENLPHQVIDRVEQRANAFSIELIAPQAAVVDVFRGATDDPVFAVMDRFGISFTAARYQIWNGLGRSVELESLSVRPGRRPDPKWEALEAYTVDYHPLPRIRPSRAGRFSAVVTRAAVERLISWDTATEMLEATSEDELRAAVENIEDLFPAVFAEAGRLDVDPVVGS